MPQKRNPRPLDRVRTQASLVIGGAQTQMLLAHNTNTGMHDYRTRAPILLLADDAELMYRRHTQLIGLLRVDRERALEELRRGFSTMTEVADMLVREAGLPFRDAHHYASALTDYASAPSQRQAGSLTDEELQDIYRQAMGERLPVPVEKVRRAMDPAAMLSQRKGLGGPQAQEVSRMLRGHQDSLAEDQAWLGDANEQLLNASLGLHMAFSELVPPAE